MVGGNAGQLVGAVAQPVELATERLTLSAFTPDDLGQLCAQLSDPEVMRYYLAPLSEQECERWLEGILRDYRTHGFGMLALRLKYGGSFVGQAGIMRRSSDDAEHHYLAYLLCRDCWGHGYATEAAQGLLSHAFGHLGIRRVEALIRTDNLRSIRLATRLGMTCEATVEHLGREHHVYVIAREANGPQV